MTKTLLHVDMDAFFASVETLDHPDWRGKPVIVGAGPHERGVVSTCNYAARAYGVHSAMPSRTAYALCPSAIFAPCRMHRYQEVSHQAFAVFGHYTPYVEGVSIDEAFLDITGSIRPYGSAVKLAESVRAEIRATCGVTCSVGIAPNRLLAKIGSEQHKPDGLTLMPFEPDAIRTFLSRKKLGILWGIGKKTEAVLARYGLVTCGDLQAIGKDRLTTILGSAEAATTLIDHAFGRSSDEVHWQEEEEKSVSREHTFAIDCLDRTELRRTLLELVKEVGTRFRTHTRWATTARLKFRDTAFNTFTRQMPLPHPSCDDIAFRTAALKLLDEALATLSPRTACRLIGFGVTNIRNTPIDEPTLFASLEDANREKHERLSKALDKLRIRFPGRI